MSSMKVPVGGDIAAVLPVLLVEYHLHQTKRSPLSHKTYAPADKTLSAPILTRPDGNSLDRKSVV